MKKDNYIPVKIKTGKPSESVWEGDRLQICAYTMLLEEEFNRIFHLDLSSIRGYRKTGRYFHRSN